MGKILVKEGVILREVNPWFLATCQKVMTVGDKWSYSPTITSLNDGKHMKDSHHYKNLAMDLRTWDLPQERLQEFLKDLKEALGPSYDVVLEKDHIHVEDADGKV